MGGGQNLQFLKRDREESWLNGEMHSFQLVHLHYLKLDMLEDMVSIRNAGFLLSLTLTT